MVLECFAKVRQSSPDNIKNEISFNLLEDISKLYISVRTFPFIKGKVQAFKSRISKKKKKDAKINISQSRYETICIIHSLEMCKVPFKKACI